MICYDFMTKLNEKRQLYEPWQESGYFGATPPTTSTVYCKFFAEDFVHTPKVIVFLSEPNDETLSYVAELTDVKQIVYLSWRFQTVNRWKEKFPDKKMVDYFELFPIDG